jgi:hypothetical protein
METGEPDEATSFTSGSEGGQEKRPAMDLARGLPYLNKCMKQRFASFSGIVHKLEETEIEREFPDSPGFSGKTARH